MDRSYANFIRHAVIDVSMLLEEVRVKEEFWTYNVARQQTIPVQRETQSIFLRVADEDAYPKGKRHEDMLLCRTARQASQFPKCMDFLAQFAAHQRASLQRAMLVRLKGEGQVYPHIDHGLYYAVRDRFHLVLASSQGSRLTSGDETVTMQAGELWWFDNKKMHASFNESTDWRIHLIFDLLR